mmetsp:Transcript_18224/g.25025  ORF Transcript_18224/g.25025 Transcript_18224/m.25025 type:complete len:110 (+) Transcript_18224:823-1152(+)
MNVKHILVGVDSQDSIQTIRAEGYNGGGASGTNYGAGGGGATVMRSSTTLASRILGWHSKGETLNIKALVHSFPILDNFRWHSTTCSEMKRHFTYSLQYILLQLELHMN